MIWNRVKRAGISGLGRPRDQLRGTARTAAVPLLTWTEDGIRDGLGNSYTLTQAAELVRIGMAEVGCRRLMDAVEELLR